MASDDNLTSIKELASKLKVTDALLKKLIKDFDIGTERVEKRIYLTEGSVTTVREVLALRASGKKNKEIKQLFEESKAEQQAPAELAKAPEKTAEASPATTETVSEEAEPKTNRRGPKPDPRKNKANIRKGKPKKTDEAETQEVVVATEVAANASEELAANIPEEAIAAVAAEYEDSEEHSLDISSYLEEDHKSEDEPSMAMRLAEETGMVDEPEASEDDSLDFDEDDDEEELGAAEEVERTEDRLSPRKIRRRQFSFRYIQRQIANDSKRIQYIQQKLKRGRLSAKEEMNLKDSLEHRSKLLSGWVHLLRWVKS